MGKDFAIVLGILTAAGAALTISLLRPESIGTPYDEVVANRAKWQAHRPSFPMTIDDVFEFIDREYAQKAFRITIAFDDVFGYPALPRTASPAEVVRTLKT